MISLDTQAEIRNIIRQRRDDRHSHDSPKPKNCNLKDVLGSINKSFGCSTRTFKSSNRSRFQKRGLSRECPGNWSLLSNKSCWKFSKVNMTWKAAYAFCTQQGGHLVDSTAFQVIKGNLSNGTRHLIQTEYEWSWSNGTSFNSSHSMRPFIEVKNTSGERCAYANKENGTTFLKDSSCDECRLFFCPQCETLKCKKDRIRRNNKDMKENTKGFQKRISHCRTTRKRPSKAFFEVHDSLSDLVQSCDFHGLFNFSQNGTTVDARITTLERLNDFRDNTTSVPYQTIRKSCLEKPNCTVARLKVLSRDLPVDISNISNLTPRAPSDVILLDYTANGTTINKLEEGEIVSLNFSNKPKDPDVKTDYVSLLRSWKRER